MGEVTLVGWGPIPRHITAKAVAVMEPVSVIKEFSHRLDQQLWATRRGLTGKKWNLNGGFKLLALFRLGRASCRRYQSEGTGTVERARAPAEQV